MRPSGLMMGMELSCGDKIMKVWKVRRVLDDTLQKDGVWLLSFGWVDLACCCVVGAGELRFPRIGNSCHFKSVKFITPLKLNMAPENRPGAFFPK